MVSYRVLESQARMAMNDPFVHQLVRRSQDGRGLKDAFKKVKRGISSGARYAGKHLRNISRNQLVQRLAADVYNESIAPKVSAVVDGVVGKSNRQRLSRIGKAAINAAVKGNRIDRAIGRAVAAEGQRAIKDGSLGSALADVAGEAFAPVSDSLTRNADIIRIVNHLRRNGYDDDAIREFLRGRGYLK